MVLVRSRAHPAGSAQRRLPGRARSEPLPSSCGPTGGYAPSRVPEYGADVIDAAEQPPASTAAGDPPARLGAGTVFQFLLGRRKAIELLARERRALLVIALLFVVSAGFAREYDGEDLLARPWFVLVPLAVSLPMALTFFLVLYGFGRLIKIRGLRFGAGALAFLTCYWMTAPLAWLYAIPYERFMGAFDATLMNLRTLTVVAAWRVLLMLRVASILLGCPIRVVIFPVLFFAASATFLAIQVSPHPPVAVMGGIRLSEVDELVATTTFHALMLSLLTIPLSLLFGLMGAAVWSENGYEAMKLDSGASRPPLRLLIFGAVAVLVWCAVLPFTQPEQRLRERVESAFRAGEIDAALDILPAHRPDDFPPHWHPPPRPWQSNSSPSFLQVAARAESRAVAPWVRTAYLETLRNVYDDAGWFRFAGSDELIRLAAILPELRQAPEVLATIQKSLRSSSGGGSRSDEAETAIRTILESRPPSQPATRASTGRE